MAYCDCSFPASRPWYHTSFREVCTRWTHFFPAPSRRLLSSQRGLGRIHPWSFVEIRMVVVKRAPKCCVITGQDHDEAGEQEKGSVLLDARHFSFSSSK